MQGPVMDTSAMGATESGPSSGPREVFTVGKKSCSPPGLAQVVGEGKQKRGGKETPGT